MTTTPAHITGIRTVSIPVDDQDAALRFYTDTLGFTVLRDNPTPNGGRWIELAPGADNTIPSSRSFITPKAWPLTTRTPACSDGADATTSRPSAAATTAKLKAANNPADCCSQARQVASSRLNPSHAASSSPAVSLASSRRPRTASAG